MTKTILNNKEITNVSVLVVGGGVNGAAILRELALQKINAILVEKKDFSSGASSACSRMIHGGIRYLEYGDFSLVKEALTERQRLLTFAPHAVKPIKTVIPIRSYWSGLFPGMMKFFSKSNDHYERGALLIRLGLLLYENFLSKHRSMPKHKWLNKELSFRQYPLLSDEIQSVATYYDGLVLHPERLIWELLDDAMTHHDEVKAMNYMSLKRLCSDGVELQDESRQIYQVSPSVVVNATGAWVDQTHQCLGEKTHCISGTKGSHLVIHHPQLREQLGDDMFFFENADGRICLILPYGDNVLVGTTDIPVVNPEPVFCDDEELLYIIDSIRQVFPSISIQPNQIILKFSGVRPLAASNKSPGEISRKSHVDVLPGSQHRPFPIISVYGGKWTTFRSLSEQAVDKVLSALKRERVQDTRSRPIGGGKNYPVSKSERCQLIESWVQQYSLSSSYLSCLLDRYGMLAERFLEEHLNHFKSGCINFLPSPKLYSEQELAYIIRTEKVVHILDLLLRRTQIVHEGALTSELFDAVVMIMADVLSWSKCVQEKEKSLAVETLEGQYGVNILDQTHCSG